MVTSFYPSSSRIQFIDVARIYGIAFMFYGHFIESYMKAGSSVAAVHYKFLYSFHMPLFFILSGYIAKDLTTNRRFSLHFKKHAITRLVPYLFLSTLLIIPTFWTTDNTVGLELPTVAGYVKGIAVTVFGGFPCFNIPSWFLICLFVVEIMHYVVSPYLTSHSRILLICFGFYLFGSILAWNAGFLRPFNMLSQHGKIFPYFMVLEAFTGYSLYLLGVYFRRKGFLAGDKSKVKCILGALTCLFLIYLTYDLNKGMFVIPSFDAVVLAGSFHGNPILFLLTAVIGSVMVMLLAKLFTKSKVLVFLGGNTVVIFGLNGAFYHFVNDRLAIWLLSKYTGSFTFILISGIIVTLISIALTIPFVFLFNRFVPQLVGKPKKGWLVESQVDPRSRLPNALKAAACLMPVVIFLAYYNIRMENQRFQPYIYTSNSGKVLVARIKGDPDVTMKTAGVTMYSAGRILKLAPSYLTAQHSNWNQQDTTPREDWFVNYYRVVPETAVDLADIKGTAEEPIYYDRLEKTEVAEILHVGRYEEIPQSLEKLRRFVDRKGYKLSGYYEETYLVFEHIESDPYKYETLLRYQVTRL